MTAASNGIDWQEKKAEITREIGSSTASNGPRREKTVWEASVILGISERTVRFHLNAAREKLDCATTTQAVAKAITQHLIDV
jgi:DNA-binding CsgD family transcriptional regulator